jgi:hypothetical protein
VSVASTDHCSVSVFWMCLTRAMHLQHELQPQLGGLVLDDEQQLVVVLRPRDRPLRREQRVEVEVAAVAHAVAEVGDDGCLDPPGVRLDAVVGELLVVCCHAASLASVRTAASGAAMPLASGSPDDVGGRG